MRTLLLLGSLLTAPGCVTIEQLQPVYGQSLSPTYGRAYFLKKSWTGSRVLVCDAKPNGAVVCYDSKGAGQ